MLLLPVMDLIRLFIVRIFNKGKSPFETDQKPHTSHIDEKNLTVMIHTQLILCLAYACCTYHLLGIIIKEVSLSIMLSKL